MFLILFFFKQKTAYEMRISDWSSDVCSSDLLADQGGPGRLRSGQGPRQIQQRQRGAVRPAADPAARLFPSCGRQWRQRPAGSEPALRPEQRVRSGPALLYEAGAQIGRAHV